MIYYYYFREPTNLPDCVKFLQKQAKFTMPECDDDYYDNVVTEIDVRRDMVANDAFREARKRKFQPSKLLKVRAVISLLYPRGMIVFTCYYY